MLNLLPLPRSIEHHEVGVGALDDRGQLSSLVTGLGQQPLALGLTPLYGTRKRASSRLEAPRLGEPRRTRTFNRLIKSQLLCQLS